MYTICIVDDREIFRRQFKRFPLFKDNDRYKVKFEAQNGHEAIELLRANTIDILITDIRMPVMDGLELLRQAKEEKLCPCIILLSEYADFAYAKQGIVLGAFDYVVKPVEPKSLKELLDRCCIQLDLLAKGAGYDNNACKILPILVLKNDEYSKIISKQIVDNALAANAGKPQAVWPVLLQILEEIRLLVQWKRPHMEKYCRFDHLFSLNTSLPEEQIQEHFCNQVELIQQQINKFAVSAKSELIQSVCNTVVENIENNLSLQSIADLYFVNKAYLSHLFKSQIGMGFTDYVTQVKMERAKTLLDCSSEKIYEISGRLGYADTEYFSRIFKQYAGVTATDYRQAAAEEKGGSSV